MAFCISRGERRLSGSTPSQRTVGKKRPATGSAVVLGFLDFYLPADGLQFPRPEPFGLPGRSAIRARRLAFRRGRFRLLAANRYRKRSHHTVADFCTCDFHCLKRRTKLTGLNLSEFFRQLPRKFQNPIPDFRANFHPCLPQPSQLNPNRQLRPPIFSPQYDYFHRSCKPQLAPFREFLKKLLLQCFHVSCMVSPPSVQTKQGL
jgi:hypothetical protein